MTTRVNEAIARHMAHFNAGNPYGPSMRFGWSAEELGEFRDKLEAECAAINLKVRWGDEISVRPVTEEANGTT